MKYIDNIVEKIKNLENKDDVFHSAAAILSKAVDEDRLIHIFGADQRASALIADIFFTPGNLTHVDPMLDPTLDIAHGAYRNAMALTVDNLAPCILDYYERVECGDPFILIGQDSAEKTFLQAMKWAKEKDLKVIAVVGSGSCDADTVLSVNAEGNQFTAVASVTMNLLMSYVTEKISIDNVWNGEKEVNLETDGEKINSVLFRIRHL